jgi:hypothetical protein
MEGKGGKLRSNKQKSFFYFLILKKSSSISSVIAFVYNLKVSE